MSRHAWFLEQVQPEMALCAARVAAASPEPGKSSIGAIQLTLLTGFNGTVHVRNNHKTISARLTACTCAAVPVLCTCPCVLAPICGQCARLGPRITCTVCIHRCRLKKSSKAVRRSADNLGGRARQA